MARYTTEVVRLLGEQQVLVLMLFVRMWERRHTLISPYLHLYVILKHINNKQLSTRVLLQRTQFHAIP